MSSCIWKMMINSKVSQLQRTLIPSSRFFNLIQRETKHSRGAHL